MIGECMGATFRFIHDDAMFSCGGTACHFCESSESPIYNYHGVIVHPDQAANPDLANEEPEIYELCAKCILEDHVRKHLEPGIQKTINRFARDKQASLEEFHRTPDIPLFLQHQDWPMCCGEWCEFVGAPTSYPESREVPQLWHYWERELRAWEADYELMPESLREVSLFKCVICKKQLFTWQFT